MKTIWKFPLAVADRQRIEMPKRAEILTVQRQEERACLWAIVETDEMTTEMRIIDIYGTGNPLPEIDCLTNSRKYIGTFQQSIFVWHVFEIV